LLPLKLGPIDVSPEEYQKANLIWVGRNFTLRILPFIALMETVSLLTAIRTHARLPVLEGLFVFFGGLLAASILVFLRIRRFIRVSAHKLNAAIWDITEQGVEVRGDSVQVLHRWSEIKKCTRYSKTLYLATRMGSVLLLPERAVPAGIDPLKVVQEINARAKAARN
jgi:hypothetical protein